VHAGTARRASLGIRLNVVRLDMSCKWRAGWCAGPRLAMVIEGIAHRGIWVEPKLLAEIEYRAKSAEGKVRHPFFKGLREDL
jgi:ATP dependent DNA ligase C terminal region